MAVRVEIIILIMLLVSMKISAKANYNRREKRPPPPPLAPKKFRPLVKELPSDNRNDKEKAGEEKEISNWKTRTWNANSCRQFGLLLKKKEVAVQKLERGIRQVTNEMRELDMGERDPHKEFQVQIYDLFKMQLNSSEGLIYQAIQSLESSIQGDVKDLADVKDSSKKRLDSLKDLTLKEEQAYNKLLKAEETEKQMKEKANPNNTTPSSGFIYEMLQEVARAADELEKTLDEHVFDHALNDPKLDLISLTVLAFLLGWLCQALQLPSMFGFVVAGVILGPSGLNIVKSVIQVESIGELGVFFILFVVGLEFSPAKLRKVFKVATIGCTMMMSVMVIAGIVVGLQLKSTINESAFVSACLSLSSTPLVVKFLSQTGYLDRREEEVPTSSRPRPEYDYGTILLGVLIMQDVWLGILMALLPVLAGHGTSGAGTVEGVARHYAWVTLELVINLVSVLLVTVLGARYVVSFVFKQLVMSGSREILVLGSVTLVFLMLTITNYLQVSMELGCFLAGVMLSAQGPQLAGDLEKLMQQIKDFLGCIFFASIGLHIFPTFLVYELTILTTLTLAVVGFKFFSSVAVLSVLLPDNSRKSKWVVSAGLAQVSEFSLVLGSRARRLGLISREVYLLILSVTTLSLLFAPILWRATVWQSRLRQSTAKRQNGRTKSGQRSSDSELSENEATSSNELDKNSNMVEVLDTPSCNSENFIQRNENSL
ncbi:transmembrane and coiled-coil domain-containing protein 3 [Lingula anatina]|uniref:Transmembrane and coiled-coil domain-containing protein 3 n=1 Tax=Lingula anatina TaxID=7574 RepID=A0A2R2MRA8_LINAN|nr:transmembrane and coiled-coil domain-containing protein 3 [Lingula anatina]|eukprot:XP_023932678.1 transmembrane and coiled-coil domain-containing protein 3 [Lingula anatina]